METPEEKAAAFNSKLSDLSNSIDSVNAKAKEQGELSSGMKESLSNLETKFSETEKELKDLNVKAQEQIDGMEVKLKQVHSKDENTSKFELELVKSMDQITEFQKNGNKFSMDIKATMLNSVHSGEVIDNARLTGVFHTPDRVQHVRNFLNTSSFGTETLRYVTESAYTDNAGVRAEGSAIGTESDLVLTENTSTPSIISSFFHLSKESLSDIPYLMNHINTRGMSKLMTKEDQQILYGTGSSNQLNGITVAADAYVDTLADSNVNRFDVLAVAVTQATEDNYIPNVIVLNPVDYDKLAREKDADGNYLFPGAMFAGQPIVIHGARVVANTAVTADDFIVGDWNQGAQLAIRSNATIEVSREHSSNFTTGLATVLIEERVALPIYRSDAFIYGDFATALAQGTA